MQLHQQLGSDGMFVPKEIFARGDLVVQFHDAMTLELIPHLLQSRSVIDAVNFGSFNSTSTSAIAAAVQLPILARWLC